MNDLFDLKQDELDNCLNDCEKIKLICSRVPDKLLHYFINEDGTLINLKISSFTMSYKRHTNFVYETKKEDTNILNESESVSL